MYKVDDLTVDLVRELLDYDPETGVFIWKRRDVVHFKTEVNMRQWNKRYEGKVAGGICAHNNGQKYVYMSINNRKYRAHMLAYVIMVGKFPVQEVGCLDLDYTNLVYSNIKLMSRSEMTIRKNELFQRKSHTLTKGVDYHEPSNKFRAAITIEGVYKCLGYYDTVDEAETVRVKEKNAYLSRSLS